MQTKNPCELDLDIQPGPHSRNFYTGFSTDLSMSDDYEFFSEFLMTFFALPKKFLSL